MNAEGAATILKEWKELMSDSFLDRCADADPETAALMMALYNEGVRSKHEPQIEVVNDRLVVTESHWYEMA